MPEALQGLKVVDFAWGIAGPQLTRCLADHGAAVVKVESATYPDVMRSNPPFKKGALGLDRSAYYANWNANKYGISLNLNHPKAGGVVRKLIAWADLVVENFAPGRMKAWGLGYEDLSRMKPGVVMVSLSIHGQTGPDASLPGFAYNTESLAGFYSLQGWPDRVPSLSHGFYGDTLAPVLALGAVLAALDHKRRTGEGQHLDLAQLEAACYLIAPLLLDYSANGRIATRMGNRHHWAAPHGAFPCRGEDRWCSISVWSEEEWLALCRAMGNPEWSSSADFATFPKRKENEDQLERLIGAWTLQFDSHEVMRLVQGEGVPAGTVLDNRELRDDPQLRHRKAVWVLDHPVLGLHGCDRVPFDLSVTPAQAKMPAPCLGQHNQYVYRDLLGLEEEEFIHLLADGAFE